MVQSAGILMVRKKQEWEFLLVHTGGPYWEHKDLHAWSFPKGELDPNESAIEAARREWKEETGFEVPAPPYIKLPNVHNRTKTVHTYLVKGDVDPSTLVSNTYEQEWPPKSGKICTFPEADRAEWFPAELARKKIHKYMSSIIDYALHVLAGDQS